MKHNIIIIDSNFILIPFQFKIDYLREINDKIEGKITFLIFQQVIDELNAKKKREQNKTKFLKHFESGLNYLEHNKDSYDLIFDEAQKSRIEKTDDFLIQKCEELKQGSNSIFLATNDQDLRRKARIRGISTIFLRQKKYICVEGP